MTAAGFRPSVDDEPSNLREVEAVSFVRAPEYTVAPTPVPAKVSFPIHPAIAKTKACFFRMSTLDTQSSPILVVPSPAASVLPRMPVALGKAPLPRRNPGCLRMDKQPDTAKAKAKATVKATTKAKTQAKAKAKTSRTHGNASLPKPNILRQARRLTYSQGEINIRRRRNALVERQREQARMRMINYRNKLKRNAEESHNQALGKARRYADCVRGCRRLTQFSRESASRMLFVGTTPSPSGARSPIATLASHIKTAISRWAVSFWRDRIFRLYRIIESELFSTFVDKSCDGLEFRYDNSPLRTWKNGQDCRSTDVMVKTIRGVNFSGECERECYLRNCISLPIERLLAFLAACCPKKRILSTCFPMLIVLDS